LTSSRCWNACLGWRELIAAAGQRVLEGQEGIVTRRSKIANRATRREILSKYKLLKHGL